MTQNGSMSSRNPSLRAARLGQTAQLRITMRYAFGDNGLLKRTAQVTELVITHRPVGLRPIGEIAKRAKDLRMCDEGESTLARLNHTHSKRDLRLDPG
ncbi:hypothetical protein PGT21_014879 [Puccinia graminis f. sp. tritici]|uniref:Uncharacterized protein n=1 Tax=Puccinia graminis f. sp. tritici TaxID=56615 RepID=A0A5B0N467_PUCGR|nr:hypothetical protein PGT21_014879 [Puccinia graminis f. sp. tritici]KAA1093266.1 hypothetical protein PGTUg99_005951 [Puccinia graminis f. sp. tritici]